MYINSNNDILASAGVALPLPTSPICWHHLDWLTYASIVILSNSHTRATQDDANDRRQPPQAFPSTNSYKD